MMKVTTNLFVVATVVFVALSGTSFSPSLSRCEAFIPNHSTGRHSSRHGETTTSLFSTAATPDDAAIQEAYSRWRQKYNKGEFSPERYQNFKSNFLAVTARNNMERTRALQTGATAPTPIKLNQYGDCSAEEYSRIMRQQQQGNNFNRNNMSNSSPGVMNGVRPSTPGVPSNTNVPGMGALGRRQQEMANNASSNLRAAMQQRSGLESDIGQLQATLMEKQRLLQEAINEEQFCADRIALREEQKRILNDRLRNGWEDEK